MAVTSGSNLTLYRSKEHLEDTVGTVGAPRNWNPCSGRPQRCQLVLSMRSPDEFVSGRLESSLSRNELKAVLPLKRAVRTSSSWPSGWWHLSQRAKLSGISRTLGYAT